MLDVVYNIHVVWTYKIYTQIYLPLNPNEFNSDRDTQLVNYKVTI